MHRECVSESLTLLKVAKDLLFRTNLLKQNRLSAPSPRKRLLFGVFPEHILARRFAFDASCSSRIQFASPSQSCVRLMVSHRITSFPYTALLSFKS